MDSFAQQIAALREAIAAGVLSVSVDGTTTTFGSFDDLQRRLAWLEDQQQQANGKGRRRPLFNRIRLG
jgi:hypothetical protein